MGWIRCQGLETRKTKVSLTIPSSPVTHRHLVIRVNLTLLSAAASAWAPVPCPPHRVRVWPRRGPPASESPSTRDPPWLHSTSWHLKTPPSQPDGCSTFCRGPGSDPSSWLTMCVTLSK